MENIIDDTPSQPMGIPSTCTSRASPVQAALLHKGDIVLINGRSCRIQDKICNFSSKNGSAKVCVMGKDLDTGEIIMDIQFVSHAFETPVVKD